MYPYIFQKRNEKIKDMVLDILMDSYEKRAQDYIEKCSQIAQNVL